MTKEYLYLAIDGFTKFNWAVTSKTRFVQDFIHLTQMVITVIKSKVAVADNYLAIVSRQFRDFLTKSNIAIIFTATNHPSKNGIAEFD